MKSLKQLLEASLLDIDANLDITDEEAIKSAITQFIKDNYVCKKFTISKNPNKDGKYEVSSKNSVKVRSRKNITSLTNNLFIWSEVGGDFDCISCKFLTALEGAPKEVLGRFDCSKCISLQSLSGAPKEVGGYFKCYDCRSLTTLEGSPEKVGGDFKCYDCRSLQSLEGSPKEVGGYFECFCCKSLESLKGAPKEVGGYFDCSGCKGNFKESDVRAVSNVKGRIVVK